MSKRLKLPRRFAHVGARKGDIVTTADGTEWICVRDTREFPPSSADWIQKQTNKETENE